MADPNVDIAIVTDPGNFMLSPGGLKAGASTMQTATQAFYRDHEDEFDFLFVFLTGISGMNDEGYLPAAYVTAKGPSGTAAPNPPYNPSQFGSAGRLKVVGDMYVTDNYTNNSNEAYAYMRFMGQSTYSAFSQVAMVGRHMMRYWGAYLQLQNGGSVMLGGNGYWSYWLNTGGSVLGGNKFREMSTNEYSAENASRGLSPLDLYLMGVGSKDDVTDLYYLSNANSSGQNSAGDPPDPSGDYIPSATAVPIDINAITAANGTVAAASQTEFRCAFILVVPITANAGDREKLDSLRLRFQAWITEQSEGAIKMNCRLSDTPIDGDEPVDGDQPFCVDGTTRCNGPAVERCINESWEFDETCEGNLICYDGECVSETDGDNPGDCAPGQKRCNGTVIERCDGGTWTFFEDCAPKNACDNAQCVDPSTIDGDEPIEDGDTPTDGDDPTDGCQSHADCEPGLRCTSAGCVACPNGQTFNGSACVAVEDGDEDDGAGGCAQAASPVALLLLLAVLALLARRRIA
jgi:hypothetical protein